LYIQRAKFEAAARRKFVNELLATEHIMWHSTGMLLGKVHGTVLACF